VYLGAELEWFPFLCKPGPEVPFVIPRILEVEGMRAVISQVPIGPHRGYAIVYFAEDPPETLERFNTWGAGSYETFAGWDSVVEDAESLDFELEPWVESGKLLWIAPGDKRLELRGEAEACPYFGLEGRRSFIRIQAGEVWDGPEPPSR
jgi:hypothetical protein